MDLYYFFYIFNDLSLKSIFYSYDDEKSKCMPNINEEIDILK